MDNYIGSSFWKQVKTYPIHNVNIEYLALGDPLVLIVQVYLPKNT